MSTFVMSGFYTFTRSKTFLVKHNALRNDLPLGQNLARPQTARAHSLNYVVKAPTD